MTHLLEKNTPFIFSDDCIRAFQTLKDRLTEAPILIAPNWDLPFELMCDASDFAIGAVLGQRHEKHFRPIHYAAKIAPDGFPLQEFDFKVMITKGARTLADDHVRLENPGTSLFSWQSTICQIWVEAEALPTMMHRVKRRGGAACLRRLYSRDLVVSWISLLEERSKVEGLSNGEVDIIKKTENQAKMTKLSMEWKRLCKIKAKVQKNAKVRVNTDEQQSIRAGTERLLVDAILNPACWAGISQFLRIILEVLPEHPSDTKVLTMKMEILLELTSNKLLWVFNSLVHSLRALSTLRRSGLRTARVTAKPCQGDSSEFYLITGRIPDGRRFSDYRPISLIGCVYKVISKLLSSRLAKVIGSVISPNQSAFIKGLPVGRKMWLCDGWQGIIDRFHDRLSLWKAKALSVGGRLTLIKFILGSLPVYYLSLFKAPLSVLKILPFGSTRGVTLDCALKISFKDFMRLNPSKIVRLRIEDMLKMGRGSAHGLGEFLPGAEP
ncbi:reverse transcriptase domain-containing protein [Tanacetum coccineum]